MEKIKRYEVTSLGNSFEYSFYSIGSRGSIRKVAQFTESPVKRIYQFRFGDINETTGVIDEYAVTNNHDTTMVLNSIVWILYDFLNQHPGCLVRFSGSTNVRTRLFLIWLASNLHFCNEYFVIYGSKADEQWERYRLNVRYKGLLIKKK